jgi:1-acyl-sn-glycerol-3-phosphate acyltransferase
MLEGTEMTHGEDGVTDSKGTLLPTLSKSASKMKIERLINTPLPTFSGKTPGSPFWTNVAYLLLRGTIGSQFKTFEVSGRDNIPTDRGSLCCAWHTNGLLDPSVIMVSHPRHIVIGGRHDLVTRPILGFWGRKLAVQPVVRQSELLRGGCSSELAAEINGRSLLKLSTGIAAGFGCFLFPEGTSHNESHLLRLKTGPMRTVLSAVALAKGQNKPQPVLLPVGLHWRIKHHWRTDAWVEFGEPIIVDENGLTDEMSEKMAGGEWVEPPREIVNELRDEVREKMAPLTPDAPDWETNRGWHLLGHLKARKNQKEIKSWKEEVLAAREIRDNLKNNPQENLLNIAIEAAQILETHRLDGRSLNAKGRIRNAPVGGKILNIIFVIFAMIVIPISIITGGIQAAVGKKLGDINIKNEGLDARTSYQFLASLFGSFFFWPPMAITAAILLNLFAVPYFTYWFELFPQTPIGHFFSIFLAMIWLIPIFWLSVQITINGWDSLQNILKSRRERNLKKSQTGQHFASLCKEILSEL